MHESDDPSPQRTQTEDFTSHSQSSLSTATPPALQSEAVLTSLRPRGDWLQWLRQGLRASALQPLRALPSGPSPWQMVLIVGSCLVIAIAMSRLEVDGPAQFSVRTWLFEWASTGLLLAGAWILLSLRSQSALHPSPVAAWFLLSSVAVVPINLLGWMLSAAAVRDWMPWWAEGVWYAWAIYVGFFVWSAAATWRIARAVNPSARVAAGLVLWTVFVMGLSASLLNTQSWEPTYADDEDIGEAETLSLSQEAFETQQALLQETLSVIKPHAGSGRQIYGVIYAPYSQDVFLRESVMVKELLEQRFDAQGRVVRLVNHPTTTDSIPWATHLNLERSIEALAKVMDKERDVVVLYLTSHGGADFTLSSQHWPLEVKDLTAEELRDTLDRSGIQNRVIAVSACYSGGWIEPLQGDNTLVMTAADKEHTSYGCGSKSELTFFGRAVFDEQLRKTRSFEEAFRAAVPVIAEREKEGGKSDGFSNPQISVGKNIQAVLREWEAQLTAEPK